MARSLVARTLLRALASVGVMRAWRYRQRHAILILTVHGVTDPSTGAAWIPLRPRLSPARLDECLTALERHYTFVSLAEAVDMLGGAQPLRASCAVLTFDDGYRNQLTEVAPVLQAHGIPATVFVSTGFVDTHRPFWFDRIDFALQMAAGGVRSLVIAGHSIAVDSSSRGALADSYAELRTTARGVADDAVMRRELDRIGDELEAATGARLSALLDRDPWSSVLTSRDIAAAPPLISFGSHTVDHCRIARLDPATVEDQLRRSAAAIEHWTGRPCRFFCYPDGDCDARAAALVRQAGYVAAVTTTRGLNRRGDDLMRLRRIDIPAEGSAAELLADVSGLLDGLLSLRARWWR